ncbi:MAG: DDE-type integrase/transposase/recombinase [Myxococcota bacterium]|nr:DDE-type integrase/transposase/recombinase [Myxococcota bacterium]
MPSRSKKKSAHRRPKGKKPLRGKRFTPEQKEHALVLVASGMERVKAAKAIDTTTESLRRWVNAAKANGTMPQPPQPSPEQSASAAAEASSEPPSSEPGPSPYKPRDPGQGLSTDEEKAIVELKQKHPSYGPAQVRAQLKRFKGWRVSIKAIKRVFKQSGFELVHRGSRPQGPEPIRFEAPHRNALWMMDFAQMRVCGIKLHLLVAIDDFSRFCVGHALGDSPSSEAAVAVLRQAIARHGKPEAVRTDRGGAFVAKKHEGDFARVLEAEMIDHIVGHSYHPQGGGKVEALIGTIRRELWDVEHFDDRARAEQRLAEFLDAYNERRAHMGIDGLTPADRYFGRADKVLARIDAISRKRQGGLLLRDTSLFEELCPGAAGAPVEVLRLCIADGQMELRFCGARLPLGRIKG